MNGLTPAQYTPLESLLFFQALRAHSPGSIDFGSISSDLNAIPLVRDDASYDNARLDPDALRNLYLSLLKEEARRDLDKSLRQHNQHNDVSGGLSPGSRKRKAASPQLPTVQDAAKHAHLLPALVLRLYTSFREAAISTIRQDEQRLAQLDGEINAIENGAWDEKLRGEQNGEQQQRGQATDEVKPAVVDEPEVATTPFAAQAHVERSSEERPASARASIDALVNHEPSPDEDRSTARAHRSTPSVTSLPPLSEMAPEQATFAHAGQAGAPPPSHQMHPSQMQAPPMPHPTGYHPSPPLGHQPLYGAQYQSPGVGQAMSPSPKLQQAMSSASPSSPRRMLPLPAGMKMGPQSPSMQNGVQAPQHGQPGMQSPQYPQAQQRPPAIPVPGSERQHARGQPPPSPQMQSPSTYPMPHYQHYHGSPQPLPVQQQMQPPYQVRPSQQGGFQLPPFQVSSQEPQYSNPQVQQNPRPVVDPQGRLYAHPPHRGSVQPSPYPTHGVQSPQPASSRPDSDRLAALVTSRLKQQPVWKSPGRPPRVQSSPERPIAAPNSPVKGPASLAVESQGKNRRELDHVAIPKDERNIEPPPKPARKAGRRTRGTSVASSNVASSTRGRTRSQSVASQATADTSTPADKGLSARKVKHEPSTPASGVQDDDPTADTSSAPGTRLTRARRGTLQSQATTTDRRIRQASQHKADEELQPSYIPPRNDIVYAAKSFPKSARNLLENIGNHKHAGPFQKPVQDKDVEGYKDIIRRPQDLQSIKRAITAGKEAVSSAAAAAAAATAAASPAATPVKDGATTLGLEKTIDLIPPKAIVNPTQLEKEIMRMFANAVMFNPGHDGIVADAREMAEDVEGRLTDWMEVERGAAAEVTGRDDGGDETGGSAVAAKRRRL